jgi:hypothetical protein
MVSGECGDLDTLAERVLLEQIRSREDAKKRAAVSGGF